MSDLGFTISAATVEVGVVALVVIAVLFGKTIRPKAVVALGALTPAMVVMTQSAYLQFIAPTPGSMVAASWVMGFAAYTVVLIVGVAVSFIRRPTNLYGRYLIGLASTSILIGLLMLV